MPRRHRAHSAGALLYVAALFCAWIACASTTSAQPQRTVLSPNATVSGDLAELLALPTVIRKRDCPTRECLFTIPLVRLKLSIPKRKNISLSFDSVFDPRLIIRETNNQTLNDARTRPLLLRGTARVRHSGASGETRDVPITGTLYASAEYPVLELSLRAHGTGRSSSEFVTVRAPLSPVLTSSISARSHSTSPFALKEMSCGTHSTRYDTNPTSEPYANQLVRAQRTYETLFMATDFDAAWMTSTGCSSASDCNNQLLGLLNQASVFYERQLGLTLKIARQYGPTTLSNTTDSSELLYDFRAHNNDHRSNAIHDGSNSGDDLVDLFQFFTGRTMDQKIVGIAFTGVLCDNASSSAAHMVVSHKSTAADPVITAHEVGHTLNASHTTSGIMTAVLGASLPSSFSSFSVAEMSSYYSSHRSECRGGTSTGAPGSGTPGETPTPTPDPGNDKPTEIPETMQLTVTKRGADAYTIKTSVSVFLRGCVVSVRAGSSAGDAETGTVILRVRPQTERVVKRGRVSASIAANASSAATVYLTADYTCPGNKLMEVSPFVSISPNTGAQSAKRVSRRAWINLLNKAF